MSEQATILIVDDEITIRKTLGLALTSKGYKIVAAGNGPEALLLLEDNVIDLALLDMRMPGMSGYEVLKEIRKSHSALELPVLMLTATDDADAMISSLKSGANDYLIKPCNREILAARIETQLSMKEMNESLISERNNLRREFVDAKVKSELDSVKFKSEFDQRTQAEKALIESERRFKVLYDARGCGLSDRRRDEFTLEAAVLDLGAVVDQLGLESFALCSFFNATPAAVRYAAHHPARVSRLVLWGGFARGADVYAFPIDPGAGGLVAANWELMLDAAVRTWTGSAGEEARQIAGYFRAAVDPETALKAFAAARDYDVTADLPRVDAPTLVVQRRDARSQRLEIARELAARIPHAELSLLPGAEASPFSGDVEAGVREVERFLGLRPATAGQPSPVAAARDAPPADAAPPPLALTEREAEVLALLCRGRSNKEIAADLGVSVHTVERHLTNLYSKLGLHSRTEAVAFGLRYGYG